MYTRINFQTKKALKLALAADNIPIEVFQPGPFGGDPTELNGTVTLEGPHYPQPHKWYATAEVERGIITKVK